jgi:hypothetical protein
MFRRLQNLTVLVALAGIALLAFTTTVDLLPHQHRNLERICPVCHPPLMGLQATGLKLPSLTGFSWAIVATSLISVCSPFLLRASSRAPPAAYAFPQ